jgi:hypothetical protein
VDTERGGSCARLKRGSMLLSSASLRLDSTDSETYIYADFWVYFHGCNLSSYCVIMNTFTHFEYKVLNTIDSRRHSKSRECEIHKTYFDDTAPRAPLFLTTRMKSCS